jgi:hypothetical protein
MQDKAEVARAVVKVEAVAADAAEEVAVTIVVVDRAAEAVGAVGTNLNVEEIEQKETRVSFLLLRESVPPSARFCSKSENAFGSTLFFFFRQCPDSVSPRQHLAEGRRLHVVHRW